MIYIVLNGGAILAATLAGLVLGTIWQIAADRRQISGRGWIGSLAFAFLAEAWLCAILAGALILAPPKGSVWTMTIGSAVVIWLGFVLPSLAASYRMRALAWRAVTVDCGYWLLVMLTQAVVLRLIGLVPPPV
ncbi:hypothetical protein AQZ52_11170 [Novosphingobium fuchskuhlense]|uniref:DUF1761 domain-containing protein n=1 Tax=Novosphingobium fuchskuhlense TaxID=1117702 RepID=A0A124JUG7_9SPHN|nr:DUF1761 domain-containing protein [Novosphingobium fuchskuhlense]KUR71222.1 hypothetical protein AQZ52_11170 [Novosphingobium fuchskuhlense]